MRYELLLKDILRDRSAAAAGGGVAYDENIRYLAYQCTGVDPSKVSRKVHERDSPEIYEGDHTEILIDPNAREKQYFGLAVAANGGLRRACRCLVMRNSSKREKT